MPDDKDLSLEIVQLEMQLRFADLVGTSFETNILKAVERDNGRLVFNTRLDGDNRFQRAAAVELASGDICLIFLSRDGLSAFVEDATISRHAIAQRALAHINETPSTG